MTIVSGSAGGPNDLIARSIAESLKSTSGLSVTVDNRAPLQVLQITSQSPPDGQTIGVVDSFSVTSFPASTANFPVDPLRDLTPIVTISATPYVLVASKRMGVTDYQGLISELKNSPGKYSYASNGFGTPSHLNAELFKALTATFITHSNMKSSATALLEISNGGASLGFFELNNVLPLIKSNQVVPIAIAAPQRISVFKEIPTFSEIQLAPLNRMYFRALVGPRGMSKELVDQLNFMFRRALEDVETRKRINGLGAMVVAGTSSQITSLISGDLAMYRRVISTQKIEVQTINFETVKIGNASNPKSTEGPDDSEEDRLCRKYGLNFGTSDYADCRIKILKLKQDAEGQNKKLQRLVELQEEERQARVDAQNRSDSDSLIRFGLDMLGGKTRFTEGYKYLDGQGVPNTSSNSSRSSSVTRSITLPNGKMVTCTTFQSMTNCF